MAKADKLTAELKAEIETLRERLALAHETIARQKIALEAVLEGKRPAAPKRQADDDDEWPWERRYPACWQAMAMLGLAR